jgi:hypothetical protein
MYTEIDYFYDGILCCVVCVGCIDKYKFDNAEYTDIDLIDGVKYWEGEPLTCECCGKLIHSEYGEVE